MKITKNALIGIGILLILVVVVVLLSVEMDSMDVGVIQGRVLDAEGNPIEGATVMVEGQNITATTAADGSFELKEVEPGYVYLYVASSSADYLDGETLESLSIEIDSSLSDVMITLSGRPSKDAKYVGMEACKTCHEQSHSDICEALDGTPDAAAHSRFVTEGTTQMVYPELWPEPGTVLVPLNPNGEPLLVQDPRDLEGMVSLALHTTDGENGREYWFKFFSEADSPMTEEEIMLAPIGTPKTGMPANDTDPVWVPVAGTIGGQGSWGEGYADPDHTESVDNCPDFGEGKQRYLARIEDVPGIAKWMEDNGVPLDREKQDYVGYLPVYIMQDGTPTGSEALADGDFGTPKLWQKAPEHWATPTNTLSRNCAGCHATGLEIDFENFVEGDHSYKAVVTEFDYKDLNIGCERCHGPGSEHILSGDMTKIITPQHLSAKASNELCGQCHASHAGKSELPAGVFKPAFDGTYKETLGNGFFVPGIYDLSSFYHNYSQPTTTNNWEEGPFHTWPDEIHGRAHAQELPEMLQSPHSNNQYQKLTCFSCHDSHSLGAASVSAGGYEFENPSYDDNTFCLSGCHAGIGTFGNISRDDIAALQSYSGRLTFKDGLLLTFEASEVDAARNRVKDAVTQHVVEFADMVDAPYTPDDPDNPVGNCNPCHMPKTGKLFDLNDDAQYHLAFDSEGNIAVAEGNVPSHVFDIVWPEASESMVSSDNSHDYDIMPNSCSRCHPIARFNGDDD